MKYLLIIITILTTFNAKADQRFDYSSDNGKCFSIVKDSSIKRINSNTVKFSITHLCPQKTNIESTFIYKVNCSTYTEDDPLFPYQLSSQTRIDAEYACKKIGNKQ